ncbi:MAG: hypothetical protein IOD12_03690 [Silvanigrellales bacterium]|nr:hypothetical protein [Silvanigrellales bacterium]
MSLKGLSTRLLKSFLLCTVFLADTVVADDQTVGNGGGYSETLVLTALQGFGKTVTMCRSDVAFCPLSESEGKAIANALPIPDTLLATQGAVRFLSEDEAPGVFPPGASVPFVANVEPSPSLAFNRTLLYKPTGTGVVFPIDLIEAYGLVGSALLSRWGAMKTPDAFTVGTRLGMAAIRGSQEMELGKNGDSVRISNPTRRPRLLSLPLDRLSQGALHSWLTLNDGAKDFDLIPTIRKALTCPPDLGTPERVELSKLRKTRMAVSGVRLRVGVELEGRYVCSGDPLFLHPLQGELAMEFNELVVPSPRDRDDRAFRFDPVATTFFPRVAP